VDAALSLAWTLGLDRPGEARPEDRAVSEPASHDLDAALVERARRGDRGALDQIVRRHQRGVWRMVRRYVRDDADAFDLTQQVFVRALGAIERFRGEASVRTWLYRIGINLALNHVRDRDRVQAAELDADALAVEAEAPGALLSAERAARLRTAVASLPPKQRLVLELRVYDELSFREVAALADCTENAAKVSFHYAVRRLRSVLADGDGQPAAPAGDARRPRATSPSDLAPGSHRSEVEE